MSKIGYMRVSTNDQNVELQRNTLVSANCEHIFVDEMSGIKAVRPGLKKCLKHLKAGDCLVVWKLYRLGRSVKNLVELISELCEREVQFLSLTDSIDTGTAMGRFFFHIMSALAEMERELIVIAGIEAARAEGRIRGRRRIMTPETIERARRILANGATRQQTVDVLGVSIKTIYKYLAVSVGYS
ncbi:MAG: recombinase family protein [Hafnia sp.]|uniref:recombinase family protein n=1 Tax=Hafnia sp. TaxID=1873498 RepID=UPI002FCA2E28